MLTKILSVIAALGLISSLILGKVYLSTRDELVALESSYNSLKIDLQEAVESKEKLGKSHAQDIALSATGCKALLDIRNNTDAILDGLKKVPKRKDEVKPNNEKEYIAYPDDRLHPELIRLLDESYNKNKRSANPTP